MRKIYCVGETVFDIIFKNGKPVDATPGGAMLNTSVSLARSNIPVSLVGDYAIDAVGNIIENFLTDNKVSTEWITRYDNAKSRLALAFLNDHNDAEYSFYKIRVQEKAKLRFPQVDKDDLVLFGSFYGIKEEIRDDLIGFLSESRERGALVLYDPNFRKAHYHLRDSIMEMIFQNYSLSHIVKGSDEDFMNLHNTSDANELYKVVAASGCPVLIRTANRFGVELRTPIVSKHYPVKDIQTVSTIGAGDNFNAGLIYGLFHMNIMPSKLKDLSESSWDRLIATAILFAEHVCLSYDNYISYTFASESVKF